MQPSPWSTFTETIAQYRDASRHLTVTQLIDLIVTTSNIEAVYDASADGLRHRRHLEHLRAIAFEYDQTAGGSVRQFVDEIARRRSEPDEMEPSLVDETRNAIRIYSVHAAKGLEFETVILPDLSFPTSNQEATELFTVEEPRSLVLSGRAETFSANFRLAAGEKLKKVATRREEAEMKRLFYVAVTRAMTDVVFVCNTGEGTRKDGFFKCLLEAFAYDTKGLATLWSGETRPAPQVYREVRMLTIAGTSVPVALETMAPRGAEAHIRKRLRDPNLEASLAAAEIVPAELTQPGPVAPTLQSAQIASRRAGSRNRAGGILLHRLLELWDGTSDPEPLLQRLAAESGVDADVLAKARQRVATIRRSPLLARIAAAETIGRELPIRFVDEHGNVVERRIDRLLRENGRDVVIDYKSGTADPDRLRRDRDQVTRYCTAITTLTGRPCEGVLWYVDLEHDFVDEGAGGRGQGAGDGGMGDGG